AAGPIERELDRRGCTFYGAEPVAPLDAETVARLGGELDDLDATDVDTDVRQLRARLWVCGGESHDAERVRALAPFSTVDDNLRWYADLKALHGRVEAWQDPRYPVLSIGVGFRQRILPVAPAVRFEVIGALLPKSTHTFGFVTSFDAGVFAGTSSLGEPLLAARLTGDDPVVGQRRVPAELGGSLGFRWIARRSVSLTERDRQRQVFAGLRTGFRGAVDGSAVSSTLIPSGGVEVGMGWGRLVDDGGWGVFHRVAVEAGGAKYLDRGPCAADTEVFGRASCTADWAAELLVAYTISGVR
ncbi:MAG: hypothetical protein ACI9K2_003390, partial [Myxococcota bacterium]